ncbi:Fur family transcriptional regulator [Caldisalinibacter kiritimatiensis]|uniref:Fe2+/Zn2+ uptake regulation protein n=1 Tax=Caldisalinibacter kiritimatiensis TaxID=1304284 RepID=R1AVZ4_9FIRM|nr:Fur family transcriptional regulator [Caldisalinibacter kiritimatiensis]EOD01353.1 Fe2+/Zn2+ uptake regulation protein [Caldisalinibacter kiritimatiensis]
MVPNKIEYIKEILEGEGYKTTHQRKLIIQAFLDNPSKHFTPGELYSYLEDKGNFVGIATVYRNLNLLTKLDIIEEVISGDEKLYELKIFARKSIHSHCYCLNCGNIINHADLTTSLKLISLIDKIENKYDFKVEKLDIIFYCHCKNCETKK